MLHACKKSYDQNNVKIYMLVSGVHISSDNQQKQVCHSFSRKTPMDHLCATLSLLCSIPVMPKIVPCHLFFRPPGRPPKQEPTMQFLFYATPRPPDDIPVTSIFFAHHRYGLPTAYLRIRVRSAVAAISIFPVVIELRSCTPTLCEGLVATSIDSG
jgi:hypothetical protein